MLEVRGSEVRCLMFDDKCGTKRPLMNAGGLGRYDRDRKYDWEYDGG